MRIEATPRRLVDEARARPGTAPAPGEATKGAVPEVISPPRGGMTEMVRLPRTSEMTGPPRRRPDRQPVPADGGRDVRLLRLRKVMHVGAAGPRHGTSSAGTSDLPVPAPVRRGCSRPTGPRPAGR